MSSKEREHVLRERGARADEAKQVLQHPLYIEAFQQVEALYTKAWATSDANDTERREQAYYGLQALRDVKSRMLSVMRDGAIVAMELEAMESKKLKEMIDG